MPALDCGSLIIDDRPKNSVQVGHLEDWEFMRSRCGMEFTVPRCELILQSIPSQWLSANGHPVWHVQWYASLRSRRQTRTRRGNNGYNQQYNPEGIQQGKP
jgi:hypothetical protein